MSVDDEELIAVVAALGIERIDVAEAAGAALGRPDVVGVLATCPGVALSEDHLRIDPLPRHLPSATTVALAGTGAAEVLRREGQIEELGRLAETGRLPHVLRDAIGAALRTQPPLVSGDVLRSWRRGGLLPRGDPYERWLDVACRTLAEGSTAEVVAGFEAARQAFEDIGEVEAEISAGLAAAVHARRIDDLATIVRCAERADELLAAGHREALAPHLLGLALRHQLAGDPEAAIGALDRFPADRLAGDWAAQVWMIRGTNLMLLERHREAVGAFVAATGHGGDASYAVALELLATARWHAGDPAGALADLDRAVAVAAEVGAVSTADLARSHHRLLAAALGVPADPEAAPPSAAPPAGRAEEVRDMGTITDALRAAADGDLGAARAAAADLGLPARAVRTAPWVVALRTALLDPDPALEALARRHRTLGTPLQAGEIARDHLAGGPPVPASFRPVLPAIWCEPATASLELRLIGDAAVVVDGRPVRSLDWDRSRVRELCLHLAAHPTAAREQVAARLWPDLDRPAAKRNLRVTLSYLRRALDPGGSAPDRSPLLDEGAGLLGFAPGAVRIDLTDLAATGEELRLAVARGDDAGVVAAARALVRFPRGELLGGAVPEWAAPFDQARRDAEVEAASAATPRLLALAQDGLAEAVAERGLAIDPWAERLHQAVVRARIGRDDLDGARRAMARSLRAVQDLGADPEPATVELARRLGLRTIAGDAG